MRFPDDIMCGTGMKGTDTCIRDRGAGAYWTHKGQKYLYAVTNTGTTRYFLNHCIKIEFIF